MSLKAIFTAMKREGYVVKDLDLYLLGLNSADEDRAVDVNSPSQAGKCMRERYYARTGAPTDGNSIDPRTRRIFDNGHGVHDRLQRYLIEQGMLFMDEIPVFNREYKIQGHTDGLLRLTKVEMGVLEIKSINSNGFSSLKDAREDHKMQGLVYVFCIESRRLELQDRYKSKKEFDKSLEKRMKEYEELYPHIVSGSKYTREEKVQYLCERHAKMDELLFSVNVPISKAVFLYENKDTQDLKEYVVNVNDASSKNILETTLEDFLLLNEYVEKQVIPPRCAKNRSDYMCKWCSYSTECWN